MFSYVLIFCFCYLSSCSTDLHPRIMHICPSMIHVCARLYVCSILVFTSMENQQQTFSKVLAFLCITSIFHASLKSVWYNRRIQRQLNYTFGRIYVRQSLSVLHFIRVFVKYELFFFLLVQLRLASSLFCLLFICLLAFSFNRIDFRSH